MIPSFFYRKNGLRRKCGVAIGTALLLFLLSAHIPLQAAVRGSQQKTFPSPEEAVKVMIAAVKAHDVKTMQVLLGPGSKGVIYSGDKAADRADREAFVKAYEEQHRIEMVNDTRGILRVGKNDWPMPIPIVRLRQSWRFDTKAAKEEILNRRIGRNELNVIQVCLAYVDAQREYALQDVDGDGLLEYAQKFESDPGGKNGLYWEIKEGEQPSPCGPFICRASKEDKVKRKPFGESEPYHGYFYKILKAQGINASGGAFDYVVNGKMIGGFALVAYPARYGISGMVTFIVNQDGQIYEKDLGRNTTANAEGMKVFDPDNTWRKVEPQTDSPSQLLKP
ncbi:MAG: DUF2950 domain-containing protein [Syntrophales bacterium]|nr:DUF2950 domain-containing protein [Syntrophales bacterium]